MSGELPPIAGGARDRVLQTIDGVRDGIKKLEWTRVRELVNQLQSQIDELDLTDPDAASSLGFAAIDHLRRQRRYPEGAELGRHLSRMREPAPLTLHAYALCRLQLGVTGDDTEDLLHRAYRYPRLTDGEREEVLAALGRVFKDRYLGSDGSSPGDPADLRKALEYYQRAYQVRSGYFPGINLAELLYLSSTRLCGADGDSAKHEAQRLATTIASGFGALDTAPSELTEWEYPTLLSCYLVLEENFPITGQNRLSTCLEMVLQSAADPFTLESCRRQMLRGWRGNEAAERIADDLGKGLQTRHSTWVLSESAEIVIDLDITGENVRRGILVRDARIAGGNPILVTSGDVAWRETVTCRFAGSLGEGSVELPVAQRLIWASSPWILDVALISITDADLGVKARAALGTRGPGPDEPDSWSARSRRTGTPASPLDDEPARKVRFDGRYVRFLVNAIGSSPGAPVLDRHGKLVAVQRATPNPGQGETTQNPEVEAVLWEAVIAEMARLGVDAGGTSLG